MNRDSIYVYCAEKAGVTFDYPFGPDVRVYRVMGKIFAFVPEGEPLSISLKCDPVLAQMLRETYAAVQPGYHLNKRHWNTVTIDGEIADDELQEMIDQSYDLIVASLKKADRETLNQQA